MAHLGKVGMSDDVIEMGNRLAAAMERLADELHTYNHPREEVAQAVKTHVWKVPAGSGDFEICGEAIRHRYGQGDWHDHETHTGLMECIDSRASRKDRDTDPTDEENWS